MKIMTTPRRRISSSRTLVLATFAITIASIADTTILSLCEALSTTTAFVSLAGSKNNIHRQQRFARRSCGGRRLYSSPLDTDDNTSTDTTTTTSLTSSSTPPQSSSTSSFFDIESFQRDSRAGEDGYSLLRRPLTFDANVDPTFEAPKVLDEEEEKRGEDVNRAWFEDRRVVGSNNNIGRGATGGSDNKSGILGEYATNGNGSVSTKQNADGSSNTLMMSTQSSSTSMQGQQQRQQQHTLRQNEEDQHLDMHQRTLDTLDYPFVLRALAQECGTVAGRQIVVDSIESGHSQKKQSQQGKRQQLQDEGEGLNEKKKDNEEDGDILTMSLSASSVQGVHRRYGAVQEMTRLMEGRVSGFVTSSRHTRETSQQDDKNNNKGGNNNKKKVQRLPLGAPPLSGHRLDLQPILQIIDEGKVLEGPEILEVTEMLELALDVVDWNGALGEVNYELLEREDGGNDETGDAMMYSSGEILDGDDNNNMFVELPKLVQSIDVDQELLDLLTNAFDDEGKLSGQTFPTVGRLRSKVRTLKSSILSSIDSLLAMPSMKSKLAIESGGALTMEINGRLVIPIQNQYRNSVGIVHDASRSGKTCYVEPTEVVGPTNELRQSEAELRAEEARVWRQLTELIIKHRSEIERTVACLGQLDLIMARVRLGKKIGGIIPTVGEEGIVNVKEARHPILLLRGLENVVGSDVELGMGGNRGLILTGPNSGGKTVILKLLGLYAFMVRDGIPVPSKPNEPARVDFFSPVLADIGDLQSVDGDLSTFSGHMLVCREVLTNAGKDALVLMDELGSGTDPNQGVAIARALLEALLDQGCRVAITTHYLELKQLASTDDRFAVAGMQFVGGRPTYRLMPGVIGESFALAVAERLKLPDSVIQRANELLDTETRKMGELIRDLEDQKLVVDEKTEELKKREYEMLELKAEMKKQQQKLEAKQLNARREEAKKFAAKLEEKERLLEDILEKLKGSGASKKVVADSWSDIRIIKREAMSDAENVPGVMSRLKQQQADANVELIPISEMKGINKVEVDDTVVVCKKGAFYGKEGVVKQVGKKIQVAVGGVPVRLTTKEIAFPPSSGVQSLNNNIAGGGGPQMSKMAQRALELDSSADSPVDMSSSSSPSPRDKGTTMKTKQNTVDCLGLTFEESKRKCIDAFSKAAMQNRSAVYILHGHGTGVLKKKIRSWLQADRNWVKSFKSADQADGGDALTRVELKKQKLF